MPAGPVNGCWAPGVWADTVWELGVWATTTPPIPPSPFPSGGAGPIRHGVPFIEEIEAVGLLDLPPLELKGFAITGQVMARASGDLTLMKGMRLEAASAQVHPISILGSGGVTVSADFEVLGIVTTTPFRKSARPRRG